MKADFIDYPKLLEPRQHPGFAFTKWYERAFGSDYLKIYPHRDHKEAMQHVQFAVEKTGLIPPRWVLDIGCGFGRHGMALTRLGFHAIGLDLSMSLLKKAQKESNRLRLPEQWIRGDMRALPFQEQFDAAFNFFTSFGYFDDLENHKVLEAIYQTLKPGGVFFFDYMNIDYVIPRLVKNDKMERQGISIYQERLYNQENHRIEKKISLRENGQWRYYFESVRAYSVDELNDLFDQVGFERIALFGSYTGQSFSANSPRLIMIGKKGGSIC